MNYKCGGLLLFLQIYLSFEAAANIVIVPTNLAFIHGTTMKINRTNSIYAFRGMRYGEPPVGDKRFKAAKLVESYSEKNYNATTDRPSCIRPEKQGGSENCLTLNIYTHDYSKKLYQSIDRKRAVMVFFPPATHSSRSTELGPQYLMTKDIVLVTVNYRLGALGFLNFDNESASGNVGLKDQVLALRFVKNHIAQFGGDPEKVTIFGHQEGASSVVLHMLSPMSKDLFHRAIAMSGSPFNLMLHDWRDKQENLNMRYARNAGCPPTNYFECLKTADAQSFSNLKPITHELLDDPMLIFNPVVERNISGVEMFLPDSPENIIKSGSFNKVPFITGTTLFQHRSGDESLLFEYLKNVLYGNYTTWNPNGGVRYISYKTWKPNLPPVYDTNEEKIQILNQDWERIAPVLFHYNTNYRNVSQAIKTFYHTDEMKFQPGTSPTFSLLHKIYFHSNVEFPVLRSTAIMNLYNTMSIYLYKFTYTGSVINKWIPQERFGYNPHSELMYVFDNKLTFKDADKEVVRQITTMWTNFAYNGKVQLSPNDDLANYFEIPVSTNVELYDTKVYDFWHEQFLLPILDIKKTVVKPDLITDS